MTTKDIKKDLREIRTYYASEHLFKQASKLCRLGIEEKVARYNRAMENAPAMLCVIYISLYVNNNMQAVVAEDLGYTPEYIKYQNSLLCKFLLEKLS